MKTQVFLLGVMFVEVQWNIGLHHPLWRAHFYGASVTLGQKLATLLKNNLDILRKKLFSYINILCIQFLLSVNRLYGALPETLPPTHTAQNCSDKHLQIVWLIIWTGNVWLINDVACGNDLVTFDWNQFQFECSI